MSHEPGCSKAPRSRATLGYHASRRYPFRAHPACTCRRSFIHSMRRSICPSSIRRMHASAGGASSALRLQRRGPCGVPAAGSASSPPCKRRALPRCAPVRGPRRHLPRIVQEVHCKGAFSSPVARASLTRLGQTTRRPDGPARVPAWVAVCTTRALVQGPWPDEVRGQGQVRFRIRLEARGGARRPG